MDRVIDIVARGEGPFAYLVLFLSAALEYVFPPFPGDTVTLFGAFLVAARGWNGVGVVSAVTVGSVAGAAVDYAIGLWLGRRPVEEPRSWLGRYWWRARSRLEPVMERLRRRGAVYLVINRFLPGVRAFFFVAAGMAGLPFRAVLFWGAVSALAWNLLLLGVGLGVGASWEGLRGFLETYTTAAWVVVGAVLLGLGLRWLLGRRRTGVDRRG